MRWQGRRRSSNVEDQRGSSPGMGSMAAAPALLRLLPAMVRSKTGRTLLVVGVLVILGSRMLGVDLLPLLFGGAASGTSTVDYQPTAEEQQLADFVAVVLADTEDTWHPLFEQLGGTYQEPKLVLFSGRVNSACGMASSAVGPFYCPGDQKLYIDLAFFDDLARRHGAPGDFAQAYVVAHEVGHHVQTLTGISQKVRQAGQGRSQSDVNQLSVRQELQADCFAGIWGYYADKHRDLLDTGDLEEALTAASAIGDDRLQQQAGAQVVPDSFTHGTSAQRVRWFRKGFETGSLEACDTFSGPLQP